MAQIPDLPESTQTAADDYLVKRDSATDADQRISLETLRSSWVQEQPAIFVDSDSITTDTTTTDDAGENVWHVGRRVRIYLQSSDAYRYGTVSSLGTRGASGQVDLVNIVDGSGASASILNEALTVWVYSDSLVSRGHPVYFSSSVTIDEDIAFQPGEFLYAESGVTVTLNGSITAPADQVIFAGPGTFAVNTYGKVYANWWAANGTSSSANSDFAERWNAMWDACPNSTHMAISGAQTFQSELNMTGYNDATKGYRAVDGGGAEHTADHNGEMVLNTIDSTLLHGTKWSVITASGQTPKVGLCRGRASSDEGIGPCLWEQVRVRGSYTVATMLSSSAERQTFHKCIFNNSHQDGSSHGPPGRIITSEPLGTFGVSNPHGTVSTTSRLSGNGHHYIDCSVQNDNGSAPLPTTGYVGATTVINGDGGHWFEQDYQRSNGVAAYHIDCSESDVHGVRFDRIWVESQGGVNADYTVSVYGAGASDDTVSQLFVAPFRDQPDVETLHVVGVGRFWGLEFKGPFASEATANHGLSISSSGPVDIHTATIDQGFAGTIDLSGITDSNSDIDVDIRLENISDYTPPAAGIVNARIHTSEGSIITATEWPFADGDTTPSVARGKFYRTGNSGATTITDFDDGVEGQEIFIRFDDSNTTVSFSSGGPLRHGGTTKSNTFSRREIMRAVYRGGDWYCESDFI